MIEARGLSKRFGQTNALVDVSLTVAPGEMLCLLGANGAGKTTLLNVFLGFLRADSGTALIDGVDVEQEPSEARRKTGYVPEHALLYDSLTGVEHVRFFAELSGTSLTNAEAHDALRAAGLDGCDAGRRLSTYSKGMRQKVALAIALAKQVPTLLLDEPLSGLDPKSAIDLSERLRRLCGEGRTVLLTTHDLFRARETATRLGIMRSGRLLHVLDAATLSHAELEQIYVESMSD
jgi:ABC-2 type transport system ATP-binding protein